MQFSLSKSHYVGVAVLFREHSGSHFGNLPTRRIWGYMEAHD